MEGGRCEELVRIESESFVLRIAGCRRLGEIWRLPGEEQGYLVLAKGTENTVVHSPIYKTVRLSELT